MPKPTKHILVCTQGRPAGHPRGCCQEKGAGAVFNAFLEEFQKRNLWASFQVTNTGCIGPCQGGTSVLVYPESVMYGQVTPADVAAIIDEHLIGDRPVERLQVPAEVWG
jgi:(2Fe-2S) ferredoxin